VCNLLSHIKLKDIHSGSNENRILSRKHEEYEYRDIKIKVEKLVGIVQNWPDKIRIL
jgi:hypothetical protein